MLSLFSPVAWSIAAREARDGPYVAGAQTPWAWQRLLLFILLAAVILIGVVLALAAAADLTVRLGWLNLALFQGEYVAQTLTEEVAFVGVLALVLISLALAVLVAAMVVYRRGAGAFLWPWPRGGWGLFLAGFTVMFLVAMAQWPVLHLMDPQAGPGPLLDPSHPLKERLIYTGGVTLGLLVAAAGEEIGFRGVLLRITGGLTRSLIAILLVNGILFAAVHLDPDPVAFVSRAASGMVWAWAAIRLGNLAFAIGAHLANNLFIALLLAPISEAALPGQNFPVELLALEGVSLLVVLAFVEMLARRRNRSA